MRFVHPGASFPKASESKQGQNMACVQPARRCAVHGRALFMVAVFFLPLIPLFQAFQEPGFARPACEAASARLLL